jgi:hypothetical protein
MNSGTAHSLTDGLSYSSSRGVDTGKPGSRRVLSEARSIPSLLGEPLLRSFFVGVAMSSSCPDCHATSVLRQPVSLTCQRPFTYCPATLRVGPASTGRVRSPQHFLIASAKTASSGAAAVNRVIDDRNLSLSGKPKISWIQRPSRPHTSRAQSRSLSSSVIDEQGMPLLLTCWEQTKGTD